MLPDFLYTCWDFLHSLYSCCSLVRQLLVVTMFIHWGTAAAAELYRFCRYIVREDRKNIRPLSVPRRRSSNDNDNESVINNNNDAKKKIENFDEIILRLGKYATVEDVEDKHKTIFLAEDDVSEEIDFSEESDSDNDDNDKSPDELDHSPRENDFVKFAQSDNLEDILSLFNQIKSNIQMNLNNSSGNFSTFQEVFPILKSELSPTSPHRYAELLRHLCNKSQSKEYKNNSVAKGYNVLIIGAGPCGLRMAIESQFLGAKTTLVEARSSFDRNNVVKLWTCVMEDLKSLGAKKLYPVLGNGSVNHISIRMLQVTLLKMALLVGTSVYIRESFKRLVPPPPGVGGRWSVVTEVRCEDGAVFECSEEYDVVICATGKKVPIAGFDRRSLDAQMSIAITANFVNSGSGAERRVAEIPGLSKQYDLQFFRALERERGIRLENIVYFKDLTHYFVMTAKKDSLVQKGVIKDVTESRETVLHPSNVDMDALERFAIEASQFATEHFSLKLPTTKFASWKGRNDVSIFDFTNLYKSRNACQVLASGGAQLLLAVVGDSLLEPFWPEGTGLGRGLLSVLDTAWLVASWAQADRRDRAACLEVLREREKLYCLLRQTDPKCLNTAWSSWSLHPGSRYTTRQFSFSSSHVARLYRDLDTGDTETEAFPGQY